MTGALDPSFSLFGTVADRSTAAAQDGTQLVTSAMQSVAAAIVAGASRVTQIIAASGSRAGMMLLDAAATALQTRSLAALQSIGTFVTSHIARLGTWVTGELRGAFGLLMGGLRAAFNPVAKTLGAAWNGAKGITHVLGGAVEGVLRGVWGGLKTALSGAWTAVGAVGSLLSGAGSMLLTILAPLWNGIASAVGFVVGRLSAVGGWLWSRLVGAIGVLWGVLSGVFSHIAGFIASGLSTVMGWIGSALASLRNNIISWAGTIGVAIGRLIGTVSSIISSLVGSIPIAGPIIQIALAGAGLMAGVFILAKSTAILGSGIGLAARTLGGLGSTLVTGIGSLGKTVWGGLSGAGRAASSWFGNMAGGAGRFLAGASSGASNLFSNALGGGSRLLASATGGSGSFGGVLAMLTKSLFNFLPTVLAFGQAVLTLVGLGVATGIFAKALLEAGKSAIEFSKSAHLLEAQSGLTLQTAARVLQGLKGFGIEGAPEGDADLFRMKASVWGLPGFDSSTFVEQLAGKFQSLGDEGFIGRVIRNGMMKSLGLNSPEWMRTAMTDPSKLRAQQAYTSNINSVLGLTPAALKAYAEDVPLFLNRLGTVWDGLKAKLATTALPIAESLLGNMTKWLGQNASKIGGWIEYAVRWMFVKAPLIAMNAVSTIIGTVQRAVSGVFTFGQILVKQLPGWLGGAVTFIANMIRSGGALVASGANWMSSMIHMAADWMAKAIANVVEVAMKGLAGLTHMLAGWLRNFAQGLLHLHDDKNSPLRNMVMGIAITFDTITDVVRRFYATMAGLSAVFPGLIKGAMESLMNLVPGGMGTAVRPLMDMLFPSGDFGSAYNDALTNMPAANLTKNAKKLFNGSAVPGWAKGINTGADWLDKQAYGWEKSASSIGARLANGAVSPLDWASEATRNGGIWAQNKANQMGDGLDPNRGQGPNIGTAIGESVGRALVPPLDFLGNVVKPGIDSISDFARSYQASLGNESERNAKFDELIAATKEQTNLMREHYRQSGSFGNSGDRVLGTMLDQAAERLAAGARNYSE